MDELVEVEPGFIQSLLRVEGVKDDPSEELKLPKHAGYPPFVPVRCGLTCTEFI